MAKPLADSWRLAVLQRAKTGHVIRERLPSPQRARGLLDFFETVCREHFWQNKRQ
jgi:hypothetical protein